MADVGIRRFDALLQTLEDGRLVDDAGAKLHELVRKLCRHADQVGKAKGELVLKLKLNVDAGGTVMIDTELTAKEPKAPRTRSMLWTTKEDLLAAENPRQTKLALREVPAPARRVRRDVEDIEDEEPEPKKAAASADVEGATE